MGLWKRGGWLQVALIIVGVTSLFTAVQRLVYARRVLGDRKQV
jgi:hypothetical protein